jgi:branched-chain amino acid aminotransferase
VFLVKNGVLETPDEGSDILLGITRDTVMKIGEYKGIKVIDRKIHREELYTADEVFLSGTAAEITPVTAVDGIDIKDGKEGPVTKRIKEEYFDIVKGKDKRFLDWLSFVK